LTRNKSYVFFFFASANPIPASGTAPSNVDRHTTSPILVITLAVAVDVDVDDLVSLNARANAAPSSLQRVVASSSSSSSIPPLACAQSSLDRKTRTVTFPRLRRAIAIASPEGVVDNDVSERRPLVERPSSSPSSPSPSSSSRGVDDACAYASYKHRRMPSRDASTPGRELDVVV
jgi:hypothetical protein